MIEQPEAVTAGLEYVSPGSTVYRRFVCPASEVNTGTCEEHEVIIRNARRAGEELSLETSGFCMVRHDTAVTDFYDQEQVDSLYPKEIEALLKKLTGAWRVPHGSFRDTSYPDAQGRESAEIRTVAYFK